MQRCDVSVSAAHR